MPTVLRLGGLRVVIYPNDHRPPHVHIVGPDAEAVFELNGPDGPVSLRESFGFGGAQLRALERELNPRLAALCERWETIHGTD